MSNLYLAFYHGTGKLQDRVVRAATRSRFSHCELVQAAERPTVGSAALCLSSSGRDGGVREKVITFKPDKWEFVDLPWAPATTWSTARAQLGKPYDYYAMFWSHLFSFRGEDTRKWFCSELCAFSLGMEMANFYAPGDLFRVINDQTEMTNRAIRQTGGRRRGGGRRGWL